MKLLLIHRDLGTGSVGKIVEDLYFGIKEKGIECKVAYGGCVNKSKIPQEDIVAVNSKAGIIFHALFSRINDKSGFIGRFYTNKLIQFIENYSPDIIHIHGCYGYWINIKILYTYLSKKNIRVINTLHSCWDFTGHCCYFTKANCEKWKTHCHHCPEKRDYPSSILFDNSSSNFSLKKKLFSTNNNLEYVAPSEWIKKCFQHSFLKHHKISLINNGIDINTFKKTTLDLSKYGICSDKKIILGVASIWSTRKGLSDFIELSKVIPSDYQIVIVGVTNKQKQQLPGNIVGINRTESKTELAALYSCASVFFNPTYEDNYPTVNLEAIACGTPVITYDTGGSPEIVEKTGFGRVIDYKDYSKIIEFVDYSNNRKQFLNDETIKTFSKEKMIEKYIDLYLNNKELR